MQSTIELPIHELKTALTGLGKVINRRAVLPVLGHLRVTRTGDGVVTLAGTDLDATAIYQGEQRNAGPACQFLVPFEPLNKLVKGGKESVTIISEGAARVRLRTCIGAGPMEQALDSLPVDEFPPTPVVSGRPLMVDANLRDTLRQALDCCGEDHTREVIRHVCLDTRYPEGHYLAATDGHHLFAANSFTFDLKQPLLIPDRAFVRWSQFMEDGTGELSVQPKTRTAGSWLQLKSGPWTFITKGCDEEFPRWKQAIPAPDSNRTSVRFDQEAVATLLAGVPRLPGHDDHNHPVRLEVSVNTLLVKARARDAKEWTRLTVSGGRIIGPATTVTLNRDYLLKALRFGLTTLEIQDELSPVQFLHGGRRMVVMPVRPPEPPPVAPATPTPSPSETPASASPSAPPVETPTAVPATTMPQNTPTPPQRDVHPGPSHATPVNGEAKSSAFDEVIAHIESVKAKLRAVGSDLTETLVLLKTAEREKKATQKEIESVRATLRSLQRMHI